MMTERLPNAKFIKSLSYLLTLPCTQITALTTNKKDNLSLRCQGNAQDIGP